MQIPIRVRESLTSAQTLDLPPIDVQGMPLLVMALLVHSITGTTPTLTGQMFTSDDLDTWVSAGGTVELSANGSDRGAVLAISTPYGRYVRIQLTLAGTTPVVVYSLYLNTYASS